MCQAILEENTNQAGTGSGMSQKSMEEMGFPKVSVVLVVVTFQEGKGTRFRQQKLHEPRFQFIHDSNITSSYNNVISTTKWDHSHPKHVTAKLLQTTWEKKKLQPFPMRMNAPKGRTEAT